jgi:hypothetical protein
MKLQFGTRPLFFTAAFVAIALCGFFYWEKFTGIPGTDKLWNLRRACMALGMLSPLWVPLAFLSFAVGRKALSARMMIGLAVLEVAAIGISYLINGYIVGF